MIVTISDLQVIRKVWRPTMRSSDRKFIKSKVRKVKIMKVFYCLVGAQRRSTAARSGVFCGSWYTLLSWFAFGELITCRRSGPVRLL